MGNSDYEIIEFLKNMPPKYGAKGYEVLEISNKYGMVLKCVDTGFDCRILTSKEIIDSLTYKVGEIITP